jgi:protein-S-isoprenylcysteine O-methyltransferase Ste14
MRWLAIAWVVYFGVFAVFHIWLHRLRHAPGVKPEGGWRDPAAMKGLLLQGASMFVCWLIRVPERTSLQLPVLAIILASMALTFVAVYHLGEQLRIHAVVTDDHRLVTSGPYRFVRHPIYLGFFGMVLANGILIATWPALAAAVILFAAGTEIRIRIEERLLDHKFPEAAIYRARVPAYLPGIR